MRKIRKWIGIALLFGVFVWCGSLIADRVNLRENIIRLHVVANSDSEEDQQMKLTVRDSVTEFLDDTMDYSMTVEEAKLWIQEQLPQIQLLCDQTLAQLGSEHTTEVSFRQEAFGTREYDTFSLPAGVYDSLRITIGEGEGRNWWCVVFPSLCVSTDSEGFADTAAGAGFPNSLTGAMDRENGYEIRFFFLDLLGRLENFLFSR